MFLAVLNRKKTTTRCSLRERSHISIIKLMNLFDACIFQDGSIETLLEWEIGLISMEKWDRWDI